MCRYKRIIYVSLAIFQQQKLMDIEAVYRHCLFLCFSFIQQPLLGEMTPGEPIESLKSYVKLPFVSTALLDHHEWFIQYTTTQGNDLGPVLYDIF